METYARLRNAAALGLGLALSAFAFYTVGFGQLSPLQQRGTLLLGGCLLAFLLYPADDWPRRAGPRRAAGAAWDAFLVLAVVAASLYILRYEWELADQTGNETPLDVFVAFLGTLCVLELTRRTAGFALFAVALGCILYARYGDILPGMLGHRGHSLERMAGYLWLTAEGTFGFALAVMSNFIYIFILFAALLEATGTGQVLIDLAFALTGRLRGGPAQSAVVASSLFGMVSGSAVANVASTGMFTIPLMKRMGFSPVFAGAVESVASSGGQLVPPVMGAGIFIMSEITGIPYVQLMVYVLVPTFFYYFSLSASIYFEATRLGLRGLSREEVPRAGPLLLRGGYLFIPVVFLMVTILAGQTPGKAGFNAILALLGLVGLVALGRCARAARGGGARAAGAVARAFFGALARGFEAGARQSVGLIAATAAIGVIVGMMTITGLGIKVSLLVTEIGGTSTFLAFLFVMVASLIMGMGLPTTAAYILLVLVVAPGAAKLGVSLVAAHLFVFYFGVISAITPPVALAAYTAAGISGASATRTALAACRLGVVGFIVPFLFIYYPSLLLQSPPGVVLFDLLRCGAGIILLAEAAMGFGLRALGAGERALLSLCALGLFLPWGTAQAAGLVAGAAHGAWQVRAGREGEARAPGVEPAARG